MISLFDVGTVYNINVVSGEMLEKSRIQTVRTTVRIICYVSVETKMNTNRVLERVCRTSVKYAFQDFYVGGWKKKKLNSFEGWKKRAAGECLDRGLRVLLLHVHL